MTYRLREVMTFTWHGMDGILYTYRCRNILGMVLEGQILDHKNYNLIIPH